MPAQSLTSELRRLARQHNREVVTIVGTLFPMAAAGWFLFFWALHGFVLLGLTIVKGPDVEVPESWRWMAAGAGAGLLLLTLLTRYLENRWYGATGGAPFSIPRFMLELVLLVPRLTLMSLGSLGAYIRVSQAKLDFWKHLIGLFTHKAEIPLDSIDLPRDRRHQGWIWQASLLNLCDLRSDENRWYLHATGRARKLLEEGGRVRLPRAERESARRTLDSPEK